MRRISRCTRLRLTSSPCSISHRVSRRLPRNGWAVYSWSRGRSCSGDRSDFFFEPLQLHLEAADLLEQLGLLGLGVGGGHLAAVAEDLVRPGQKLFLPAVDQGGVDPVVAGQLVDRLVPLEGSQGHLGLERRRMLL